MSLTIPDGYEQAQARTADARRAHGLDAPEPRRHVPVLVALHMALVAKDGVVAGLGALFDLLARLPLECEPLPGACRLGMRGAGNLEPYPHLVEVLCGSRVCHDHPVLFLEVGVQEPERPHDGLVPTRLRPPMDAYDQALANFQGDRPAPARALAPRGHLQAPCAWPAAMP